MAAIRWVYSRRHVHMTISLAFLAPSLVRVAVDGRLRQEIGVASLSDAPIAWSRQLQMLGALKQRLSLALHNCSLADSSPAGSATQFCAIPGVLGIVFSFPWLPGDAR
jgi:hypothetical protein